MLLGAALHFHPHLLTVSLAVSLLGAIVTFTLLAWRTSRHGLATAAVLTPLALWRWALLPGASPALPELPCAALLVFSALCFDSPRPTRSAALMGAMGLTLACGFRYEAWFATAAMLFVFAWRHPRNALLSAPIAALVPVGWLFINHHRTGDVFDFLHRVERFRLHEGIAPLTQRLRTLITETLPLAPLIGFSRYARRAEPSHETPGETATAGALAVVFGVVLGELLGGGASHHSGRSLLFAAVLIAPAASVGAARLTEKKHIWVLAFAVIFSLVTGLPRPSDLVGVEPSAVITGRRVHRALERHQACHWTVIADRSDRLWVMLTAGATSRLLFLPPGPIVERRAEAENALARSCVAAVERPWSTLATSSGMHRLGETAGWAVYAR